MFLLIEKNVSLYFSEYEMPKHCFVTQERVRPIFKFMKYLSTTKSLLCATDRKFIKLSFIGHFRGVSDIVNTVYFVSN